MCDARRAVERQVERPGRVVILNGPSSGGKTALAAALQSLWEGRGDCWLIFSWDDFVPRLPDRWRSVPGAVGDRSDEGISYRVRSGGEEPPRALLVPGSIGRQVLRAYHHAVAAMAHSGVNVLVEEVMISADERADWDEALSGVPTTWVAVRCDDETAAQREHARGDRYTGLARGTNEVVHCHAAYDIEVDTTVEDAETLAVRIDAAMSATESQD
jgi:chloramphenicol 3-O phosphotransferase